MRPSRAAASKTIFEEPARIAERRPDLAGPLDEIVALMDAVLGAPLKFQAIETPGGKRYEVTGAVVNGQASRAVS